jgi:uncharacterized membrane protein YGL010W
LSDNVGTVKTLVQHLTEYASYHRDRRNIATHFLGIPMIVVSAATLFGGLHPYVAMGVGAAMTLFYLVLDLKLGLAMAAFTGACVWLGLQLRPMWLIAGVTLFVVGWVFQFVGHWFEGKKPAFVDDVVGLLVGPLFIVTELVFLLGLRKPLQDAIEAKVGPTRINPRRGAAPAAQ